MKLCVNSSPLNLIIRHVLPTAVSPIVKIFSNNALFSVSPVLALFILLLRSREIDVSYGIKRLGKLERCRSEYNIGSFNGTKEIGLFTHYDTRRIRDFELRVLELKKRKNTNKKRSQMEVYMKVNGSFVDVV